jgi:predicted GTPase
LYERHWKILDEPRGLGRGADDTFQEEAAAAIFENLGGYVAGRGGVGKSHLLRLIKALFQAAGFTVDVIAFTHVQASNVDGDTVLHHLHSKLLSKKHIIIVDES